MRLRVGLFFTKLVNHCWNLKEQFDGNLSQGFDKKIDVTYSCAANVNL